MLARFLLSSALFAPLLAPIPAQQPSLAPAVVTAIDRVFAPWSQPTSPGCSVGVFSGGRTVHARGYGMADLERRVPLRADSVFDIASTSKQFFAFAILLLEHDGKLGLDDDVRQHLPEIPAYGAKITVRHLLHHTSGIRDYLALMSLAGMPFAHDYPEAQILALIARQKDLNFAPGDQHLYSNSGYFLLAEIVRRVSHQTPGEFLTERIFTPLGMRATRLYDDYKQIVPNRALGYLPQGKDGHTTQMYLFDLVGDGGVLTCLEDLARWDDNFYDNRLGGGAELIERMLTPGTLNSGKVLDYACGLRVGEYRGLRFVDHGGAWAGYRSQFLRFPSAHVSIAVLANSGTFDPDSKALAVADLVLADKLAPVVQAPKQPPAPVTPAAVPPAAATLATFAGTYRSDGGRAFDVTLTDGALHLQLAPEQSFALVATADARFATVDAPVQIGVQFLDGGKVMQMEVADQPPRRFARIVPWAPSAAELAEYAGDYHSDELETIYRVRVAIGYQEDVMRLTPTVRDEFALGGGVADVERSEGKVGGFRVNVGRVRGIVFTRR